jgi:hypothetical protein
MSAAASARRDPEVAQALMDVADAIADMAQRDRLNGPEPTYASEKLAYAVERAAEGLAFCGAELHEVIDGATSGQVTAVGCWSASADLQ